MGNAASAIPLLSPQQLKVEDAAGKLPAGFTLSIARATNHLIRLVNQHPQSHRWGSSLRRPNIPKQNFRALEPLLH